MDNYGSRKMCLLWSHHPRGAAGLPPVHEWSAKEGAKDYVQDLPLAVRNC